MAIIRSIKVRGLAGRRKSLALDLQPDLNVIWGLNGSGKTSLLKIIHSALVDDATSLLRVPFDTATVVLSSGRSGQEIVERHIDRRELLARREATLIDDDDAGRAVYYSFSQKAAYADGRSSLPWHTSNDKYAGMSYRHGYLPISRISEGRGRAGKRRTASELIDEAAFDRLFADQIQEVWQSYTHRALMQIRSAQDRGLAGILRSVLLGGNNVPSKRVPETAEEAYALVQDFFSAQRLGRMLQLSLDDFRESYTSNKVVTDVVAEIRDVQRGIEAAQEPQRRIESLLSELYTGGKAVALSSREVGIVAGGKAVPLESLSSGEKQMLQLLLETLAAENNPVLIDEPELSLHVDWQSRLIDCLQSVNEAAQLIMATHSPEVMARLADRHIFEI